MRSIDTILNDFNVDLKKQIGKYKGQGRKLIGCAPAFVPEELVYASGMLPLGIWGAEGEITAAKQYFPAFYPAVVQRTMDLGLSGELDDLEAMIIPGLSDSLKALSQNWKQGVKNVKCLYIACGQNRKIKAGIDFNEKQYIKLKKELEEISGEKIQDSRVEDAIKLYNEHRKKMMEFSELASVHPVTISPSSRSMVLESSYLMDKAEHSKLLEELNENLRNIPEEKWKGGRVVTTGAIANSKSVLELFEKNKLAIVGDEIMHESVQFKALADEGTGNPIRALAKRISDAEGCMLLYDPEKKRADLITDKVKKHNADGVVYLLTKFCDSDEFDCPIIRNRLNKEGIRNVLIEVDQQMTNFEQADTALQTFADMIG